MRKTPSVRKSSEQNRTPVFEEYEMTNKTILEYSDFKNPFLKVTVFDGVGQKSELLIEFSDYELENGEIVDTQSVVARIKQAFAKIYPVELLLSCEEIYKSVFTLPKTNRFFAEAAYHKQLKEMQRDDYTVITDHYTHSVGCVYNSYFVPNRIVNCLKKIVKDLNARVEKVRLFGMWLKEQLNYKKNYVYFYIRNNLCRMLLVVENRLITEYDFTFDTVGDIKRQFLMVASKHEFEFERQKISYYGLDSDIPLELSGLKRVDEADVSTEGIEIEYDDPMENMTNTKPSTFEERLRDCPEYVRKRYEKLSEDICSYSEMECQITDVCAMFYARSKVWFKIDIDKKGDGKRISLYIADDPMKFALKKVPFAISKKQNFLNTPCLIRISTNTRFSVARQMIRKCMSENNIPLADEETRERRLKEKAEKEQALKEQARREKQSAKKAAAKQKAKTESAPETEAAPAENTPVRDEHAQKPVEADAAETKYASQTAAAEPGPASETTEKQSEKADLGHTGAQKSSAKQPDSKKTASEEQSKEPPEQAKAVVKPTREQREKEKAKQVQQARLQRKREQREKAKKMLDEKNKKAQAALKAQKESKKQ